MAKIRFKRNILRTTSPLEERGYQNADLGRGTDTVGFLKFLEVGIRCQIYFDLKQHFFAPVREFDVMVHRRPTEEYSGDNSHFAPVTMNIPNLMRGVFKQDIFPEGKFHWAYTDEQTLLDEATHAVSILIDYGIPWLEDPHSNIEWVFKTDGNTHRL